MYLAEADKEYVPARLPSSFQYEDIEKCALASNSKRKIIDIGKFPMFIELFGPMAMYNIPGFKVERLSYDVPTFCGLRNTLGAIYRHPGVEMIPVACVVHNPIRFETVSSNGVSAITSPRIPFIDSEDMKNRMQMSSRYLMNVRYTVAAVAVAKDTMQKTMDLKKFQGEFRKAVEGGCGTRNPFLGTKECPAFFRLVTEDHIKPALNLSRDYRNMLFDLDYANKYRPNPTMMHVVMENGVIDFTRGEKFKIYDY